MKKGVLTNIFIVIVTIIVAYFAPRFVPAYLLHDYFFPPDPGGGLYKGLGEIFISMFILYSFLVTLLFTIWGDEYKYWWTGVLFIPMVWVASTMEPSKVFFYVSIGIIGLLVGFLFNKSKR